MPACGGACGGNMPPGLEEKLFGLRISGKVRGFGIFRFGVYFLRVERFEKCCLWCLLAKPAMGFHVSIWRSRNRYGSRHRGGRLRDNILCPKPESGKSQVPQVGQSLSETNFSTNDCLLFPETGNLDGWHGLPAHGGPAFVSCFEL